jgi:hypothetical protein
MKRLLFGSLTISLMLTLVAHSALAVTFTFSPSTNDNGFEPLVASFLSLDVTDLGSNQVGFEIINDLCVASGLK